MKRGPCCLSLLGVLVAAAPAAAQGFGVNEHGTCMMGRAGAGIAAPCDDGSALFFNPAGLVGRRGVTVSLGVTGIQAVGGFSDDATQTRTDLDNAIIPVPHAYVIYGIDERMAAGIGVFVPYGLGTRWPETFAGRFLGYDNALQTIYVQPTFAYRPHPMVAIGAGADLLFGNVTLTQRVDLSAQQAPGAPAGVTFGALGIPVHTDMATALLEGSGTAFGGHFGLLVTPHERVSIGARYLLPATIAYDGTIDFTQVSTNIILPPDNPISITLADAGEPIDPADPLRLDDLLGVGFLPGQPLANGTVTTSITMPAQIAAGVAVRATPALMVFADWQMVRWSAFDTLRADFTNADTPDLTLPEDYRDTHGVRLGLEWTTSDRLDLRGGFTWHEAAAPDQTVTPLLPEGERRVRDRRRVPHHGTGPGRPGLSVPAPGQAARAGGRPAGEHRSL